MSTHTRTLAELAAGLRKKEFSSAELAKLYLDRIEKAQGALNAFVSVSREQALIVAAAADRVLASGLGGPLTGLPIAHKDIFCTRDLLTTCGSRMLANFVSPYNAHVIEQFDRAGAVLLGKCNMDEFAMGSSNETSHFGPVRNPWGRRLVPGGSSGGAAAAVAARMAPAATGTDTGGSIRQPAALSGVCGLKPTYGVVSRYGMVAFASSLDQGGPLAKSAADLAAMMNVMAGFDARDSTSLERPKEDYGRSLNPKLQGLRIGLPKEYFGDGIDPGVRNAEILFGQADPQSISAMASTLACATRSRKRPGGSSRRARAACRSSCRTRSSPCRCITSSPPPRRPRTFRASTACATATAPRTTAISPTCIAARAQRASAPR